MCAGFVSKLKGRHIVTSNTDITNHPSPAMDVTSQIRLCDCSKGSCVTVVGLPDNRRVCRELLFMGLTPGTSVSVDDTLSKGGAMILNFRGSKVAIRAEDAAHIHVCAIPSISIN